MKPVSRNEKVNGCSCKTPRGMGVPPMEHGQDARATPAGKGFCKSLNGYSLVEVLVAVALSTLVLGGVLLLVSGGSRSWRVIALQMQADQDVNAAMTRLVFGLPGEKGVRCAASATVNPGPAGGDWILSYAPGSVTSAINEITYDAAERRLLFEPGGRLVGRGIDFAWAGADGRSLTITLRVSRTSGPLQAEAEAATYVLFRNLNR